MNDRKGFERSIMSHSMRKKLITTKRFDVGLCAKQIAKVVVEDTKSWINQKDNEEAVYCYDGERIEKFDAGKSVFLGERLLGDFFDVFPSIEIEVKVKISNHLDVDGYYYHTLDHTEEDGLVEVIACIPRNFFKVSRLDHLVVSISSVLSHEMQHVVQRCYGGIDMAQIHDEPKNHLADVREVDARVEEVMSNMLDIQDDADFSRKMSAYISHYLKRNKVYGVDETQTVRDHVEFYREKILEHFHNSTDVQNETARSAKMPNGVKVPLVVV